MSIKKSVVSLCFLTLLSGCNAIATSTNMLSDDDLKSQTAGALGYDPSELTVVNRRTEGTNTYVSIKAKDKQEFNCIINGGNLLTFGMTNPPSCAKKGEVIKSGPFGG